MNNPKNTPELTEAKTKSVIQYLQNALIFYSCIHELDYALTEA